MVARWLLNFRHHIYISGRRKDRGTHCYNLSIYRENKAFLGSHVSTECGCGGNPHRLIFIELA